MLPKKIKLKEEQEGQRGLWFELMSIFRMSDEVAPAQPLSLSLFLLQRGAQTELNRTLIFVLLLLTLSLPLFSFPVFRKSRLPPESFFLLFFSARS